MGTRIAAAIATALALLALASMTSTPLSAQEPSRTKIDVPRDEIDKILLEAKKDKGRAIHQLKSKIKELDKQHDDLLYELVNVRTKLKRAVEGLNELEPSQESAANKGRPDEDRVTRQSGKDVLRPRPSPRSVRERNELLKKYEDEAAIASKLESEASLMIQHLKKMDIKD